MIKKDNKTIKKIYKGSSIIDKIYKGTVLIYELWNKLVKSGIPPLTLTKCKENNLLNYQVYGNSIQGDLPEGYTQLEYIESSGTQYIDTGVKPNNNTNFKIKVNFLKSDTGGIIAAWGSKYFGLTGRYWGYGNYESYTVQNGLAVYRNEGPILFKNDVQVSVVDNSDMNISNNIVLFALNYNNNVIGFYSSSRIYYCEIYNGENLIRNFIPCKNSSGTIGMYDTVTKTFYANAGTGDFIAGAEMPNPTNPIEIKSVGDLVTDSTDENYGKYKIPIKKSSSNLLPYPYILNSGTQGGVNIIINDDGSIKLNGTTTGLNTTINTFRLKAGTYTISGNPSPDVNLWLRVVESSTSAHYVRNYNGIKGTLTIAEDSDMYVYITINKGVTVDNVTIYPMVNDGIMDLEYSKYFTPVTTNIYLDEPLRKIGDGIPSRLPEGYTPLGYIETASDSFRSFITTDIPLNTISYIEFEYKLLNTVSQHPIVFSSYTSSSIQSVAPYICVDGGANGSWIITPKINKSSQEKTKYMITNNNTSTNLLKIGGWYDNYWTAKGRYYYVKIYDKNNKLIRYFVPCKNSNNVVGMYDTVNNIFYKSAGTKEFIAGNIMYADYIDFETQKVYRNVKKINLSTTLSDFSFYTGWDNEDYTTCFFNASDKKIVGFSGIMSNYFKSGTDYHANVYDNQITGNYGNRYIYIKIAKTIATSKTELNNWLNTLSTPVEIIYQLASTTEESIELPDILLNKGTNVVDVETSLAPSNIEVKYLSKSKI